jgi:site-specific DNA-cytosine methylase
VRAPAGLPRRLDGDPQLAAPLTARYSDRLDHGGPRGDVVNAIGWVRTHRAESAEDPDHWRIDDALLPEGLDSSRYRALGNAVPPPMTAWIARRLRAVEEGRDPDARPATIDR